jgi:tRNA nucleotidyltransferase (CCA-adding enzyme)
MEVIDRAAARTDRVEIRFAALAHDLGKALTPDEFLPRHPDHDARGLDALREWNREMTLPRLWRACASFAISWHMRAKRITSPAKIADLVERLRTHPIGVDGFETIMFADRGVMPDIGENIRGYIRAANSVKASDAPPGMSGKALGEWLKNARAKAVGDII